MGTSTGSGTFTKTGIGTLTVNGSLEQSGDLSVSAGALVVNGIASHGGNTIVAAGASVEFNVAPNSPFSFSPSMNVNGSVIFDNVASLTFSPGTYTSTGTLVIKGTGSTINGAAGSLGGPAVNISNAILLNPASAPNFVTYIGMAGQGNNFWLQNSISGNSDVYFAAGFGQSDGANINLYSSSTYTGNTYLNFSSKDVLIVYTNNALPTTTQLVWGVNGGGGGAVDLNGYTLTVAGISTDPAGGSFGGLEDTSGGGLLVVNGSSNCTFDAPITTFLSLTVRCRIMPF